MKKPFGHKPTEEPAPVDPAAGEDTDTMSAIRRLTEDDDRPSREDRSYGETIFTRPPVNLPRILTGRRRSKHR